MISVITPVFNGADHIPRTLDSLAKQATSFEHIVMDACSTDDTLALVASFADRYALRVEPARGSHQFWILTNRLKLPAAHQIKAEVDTLYEPYGIYRNVWGTLIRELNIDFGYFGSIFFLFLMGLAVAFCKRQIRNSCTAQFVYLYLFSIMIFSPFSSILKAQCMQSVIYAIVPLFVAEILLLKRRQNAN